MNFARKIRCDQAGAAAVEAAFALPILLLFVFGIFQFGVIFQANAGMQHALGEGARHATLHPAPSDTSIETRMSESVFGMNVGTFETPKVTTPASTICEDCKLLTVKFTYTPNFIFFNGPAITLTQSKQVYLST